MMKEETTIRGHRVVFRTWTYGDKQRALRQVTEFEKDPKTEKTIAKIDAWKLNDQMLLATLVEWDLTKADGSPLLITLDALQALEPPELVEEMIEYTQKLNGVSENERKK